MIRPKETDLELLSETFLFRGMAASEISRLTGECGYNVRSYKKGEVVFSPENFERALGIILAGRVAVTKRHLSMSELCAGDLFGAASLFNDRTEYASTITAKSPCSVMFFGQESVRLLLSSEKVRDNYIRYLSQRIRFLSDKVDALSEVGGGRKLSAYLLKHSDDLGRVSLGCTLTELSSRLNISRASLYRELDKLTAGGIIEKNGSVIEILKPECLIPDSN